MDKLVGMARSLFAFWLMYFALVFYGLFHLGKKILHHLPKLTQLLEWGAILIVTLAVFGMISYMANRSKFYD